MYVIQCFQQQQQETLISQNSFTINIMILSSAPAPFQITLRTLFSINEIGNINYIIFMIPQLISSAYVLMMLMMYGRVVWWCTRLQFNCRDGRRCQFMRDDTSSFFIFINWVQLMRAQQIHLWKYSIHSSIYLLPFFYLSIKFNLAVLLC